MDEGADLKNAFYFTNYNGSDAQFLEWFLPPEIRCVLNKKFSKKQRNKELKDYTGHTYKTKCKEIKIGTEKANKDWAHTEKKYFGLVDKIFKKHPWPKGRYVGYATIYNMYPRDISRKTFFFPYKHRLPGLANQTIAHEMLHFIFFDYISKRYRLKENSILKNKPQKYLWEVSEVFNSVMASWPPYKKIFGRDPYGTYPGTEKMYKKMRGQWQKEQDIDRLLDKWLKT